MSDNKDVEIGKEMVNEGESKEKAPKEKIFEGKIIKEKITDEEIPQERAGVFMENIYLFDREEEESLLRKLFLKKQPLPSKILSIGAIHVLEFNKILREEVSNGKEVIVIGDSQSILLCRSEQSKVDYGAEYDTIYLTKETIEEITKKLKIIEGYVELDTFSGLTIKINKTITKTKKGSTSIIGYTDSKWKSK